MKDHFMVFCSNEYTQEITHNAILISSLVQHIDKLIILSLVTHFQLMFMIHLDEVLKFYGNHTRCIASEFHTLHVYPIAYGGLLFVSIKTIPLDLWETK